MPALNHHHRFAAAVALGRKRQTIRKMRKRPIRIGDTLYHWVDQRSPNGRRIRIDTCRMAVTISIYRSKHRSLKDIVWLGHHDALTAEEVLALARADGFESAEEMLAWIDKAYGLPFVGQVIQW